MTVLNTYPDIITFVVILILITLSGIGIGLIIVLLLDNNQSFKGHQIAILLITFGLIGLAFGFLIQGKPETKYDVILDDSYSAKELYDNYIIIEKNGEIWTLKEKN